MKNLFLLFMLFSIISLNSLSSQSIKIAIIGISSGGSGSGISFVAVNDIPANTIIYFTDEEYRSACSHFAPANDQCGTLGETFASYTSPAMVLTSGTVIKIEETASNILTVTGGGTAIKGGTANYSISSSDVIHAFLSDTPATPTTDVDEVLASFNKNTFAGGTNDGDNPITQHPNAIVFEDTGNAITDSHLEYDPSLRGMPTSVVDLLNPSKYTTSGSSISLSTTDFSVAILPVEFTSFSAETDRAGVLLKWQTAKEENNDYFQIERSIDGRNFSTLGKIDGNGTTNNFSNYTFLDEKPAAGINYYRLKQVDYDGAFEYSDIASAQFGDGSATVVVYPNPFSDQLTLSLPTGSDINDRASNPVLKITNLHGQVIKQEALVSTPNHSLNLGDLAAGTYILQVYQDGQVSTTQRLVKL